MVRAPCCEKMGLKKGPWAPEEDRILMDYIQQNGHGNWRALPKQAGLLRCGKSCRLRWINYLRPDIKRGSFTREEEDTIIQLHEMLGNRWSAIAAKLPGRTDNEIKNVWHTHLKKRLKQYQVTPQRIRRRNGNKTALKLKQEPKSEPEFESQNCAETEGLENRPISPSEQCSSDVSSVTTGDDFSNNMPMKVKSSSDEFLEGDENFWLEVLSTDNSSAAGDFPVIGGEVPPHHIPFSPPMSGMEQVQYPTSLELNDSMDFWYNLFTRADQEITELPKI